ADRLARGAGDVDRLAAGDRQRLVAADRLRLIAVDGLRVVSTDVDRLVRADVFALIVGDGLRAIVPDGQRFVVADRLRFVGLDRDRPVLLPVQIDLFGTGGVFEAQLVGAFADRGVRLDAALGLVVGQGVGRGVLAVVDATRHQRTIGIALEERDHDFHAHARDELGSPARTGPALRHADPARRRVVVGTVLLPMELHADAPVLVHADLVARGPDHDRRLRAVDLGFGRALPRADRGGLGHALERVLVAWIRRRGAFGLVRDRARVLDAGEDPRDLERLERVTIELEHHAGAERGGAARAPSDLGHHLCGFEVILGALFGVAPCDLESP